MVVASVTAKKVDHEQPLLGEDQWRAVREWYHTHGRHGLPWRVDPSPWKVLIAETLLHRTRADAVQLIYSGVVERFPSPNAVLDAADEWIAMTQSIGLVWRSRTFLSLCRDVLSRWGGDVPSDMSGLLALPGVGHYTARAVRCFGFGIPDIVVDTNTIRLAGRMLGSDIKGDKHRTAKAKTLVDCLRSHDFRASDNYALLDLASLVCRPLHPSCDQCPLQSVCITARTQAEDAQQQPHGEA